MSKNLKTTYKVLFVIGIFLILSFCACGYQTKECKTAESVKLENVVLNEIQFENKRCLVISNFAKPERITKNFLNCDCINLLENSENGILYRSECLPFVEKFYDFVKRCKENKKRLWTTFGIL